MKFLIAVIGLLSALDPAYGQRQAGSLAGNYVSLLGLTSLQLHADSTFTLTEPDFVFPYKSTTYRSSGTWTAAGDQIRLNPGKKKRLPTVRLMERTVPGDDSITVRIDYRVETYRQDSLINTQPFNFNLLTLAWNHRHQYKSLVHRPIRRVCAFAPRIGRQVVVDSCNSVRLGPQKLNWLSVYTYGFAAPVKLPITRPGSNNFEITITQPVDEERTRRDKLVIIKGKKAYFYGVGDKVDQSVFALPLKRKAE